MTMKCRAELHIGDDEGDNHATMTCGLEIDHIGFHTETYPRQVNGKPSFVTVTWEGDDNRSAQQR